LFHDRLKAIVTCEHATPNIPAAYRKLFVARRSQLASHLGWDIGALDLAKAISRSLASPLMRSEVSRLLVDLNRSVGHSALFSGAARPLSEE
jgi:predicted N-formylglutamate amidohydrolase